MNHDQFAPNSAMTYKTIYHVSVPNLKLFAPMKSESWVKEVYVTWENGLVGIILPINMAAAI